MAQLFAYLFFFLIGGLIGAGSFMSYGLYQVRKMRESKKSLVNEIKKKADDMEKKTISIKDRLVRASQIAQTQMELRAQAEMPSKNALHSKYKNQLVEEISGMEQEKLSILKTILAEGFDPMITVMTDGAREDILLSEYVASAQQTIDSLRAPDSQPQAAQPPPLPDSNEPRKVGKFFIYKGGKDDGKAH